MWNRVLICSVLIVAVGAHAAPPDQPPAQPEDIDVDALARAKDVHTDAQAKDATAAQAQPAEGAASADSAAPTPAAAAADPTAGDEGASESAAAADEQRLAAACAARAAGLLDAAQKGDYAAATADFDARMRSALPPPKFQQAWESLARFGALQARGQSHPMKSEGYVAVMIPLIYEKANLYAQIACGSDGRIAGFYIKPIEVPAK